MVTEILIMNNSFKRKYENDFKTALNFLESDKGTSDFDSSRNIEAVKSIQKIVCFKISCFTKQYGKNIQELENLLKIMRAGRNK
jgi:hypothetical protein